MIKNKAEYEAITEEIEALIFKRKNHSLRLNNPQNLLYDMDYEQVVILSNKIDNLKTQQNNYTNTNRGDLIWIKQYFYF